MLDDDPDTKILDIITNRREESPSSSSSSSSSSSPGRRPAVDLRALQDLADPETDMGAEDDDLIVMKVRRDVIPPDPPPAKRRRPIKVIEKHPIPVQSPPLSSSPSEPPPPVTLPGHEALEELELEQPAQGLSPILVIFGAALIAGLGVGGVYWGMRLQAGRQVAERTEGALASGNFNELSGLELQLAKQVQAEQAPLAERATALATVRAVLWSEYTGDLEDRDNALAALETAAAAGARPEDLVVARATLALSVDDLSAVSELMATDVTSDELSYLRVHAALAVGDDDAARLAWPSPPPSGERYAVLDAIFSGEDGYQIDSDNLDVTILAHEQRWGELQAPARLQAVAALLKAASQMSPRQRARLYAVSADLNGELGRENLSRISWGKALEQAPARPEYLYAVASREIAAGASRSAAERLAGCVSIFATDTSCHRAYIAALLELDRLDEAAAAAGSDPLLSAWVQVIAGEPVEVPEGVGPSGLSDYLIGLQAASSGDTDMVESAMSLAQVSLGTNPEPELRYLSKRALAVLVEHGNPRLAGRRARELQVMGSADPGIYVCLSGYYQSIRRRTDASQYQSHASMLSKEWDSGLASYSLGVLYADAGQDEDAQVLFRQYLSLVPSGPRAERAAAALQP
jgi:tetratricopeptide (TPR) repeat protein